MSRATRAFVPLAISLVVALGLASPARSDQAVVHDRRHDVYYTEDGDIYVRRPALRDPDVVRTRINHSRHRVVIRLRFANLRRHGRDRGVYAEIKTPDHQFRLDLSLSHRRKARWISIDYGRWRHGCPNVRQDYQIGRDVIRVQIPRSCLRRPSWVRVHAESWWEASTDFAIEASDGANHITRRLYPG
jgi:hypothetical protein